MTHDRPPMTWEEIKQIGYCARARECYATTGTDAVFIQGIRLDQLIEIFRIATDALRAAQPLDFQI